MNTWISVSMHFIVIHWFILSKIIFCLDALDVTFNRYANYKISLNKNELYTNILGHVTKNSFSVTLWAKYFQGIFTAKVYARKREREFRFKKDSSNETLLNIVNEIKNWMNEWFVN